MDGLLGQGEVERLVVGVRVADGQPAVERAAPGEVAGGGRRPPAFCEPEGIERDDVVGRVVPQGVGVGQRGGQHARKGAVSIICRRTRRSRAASRSVPGR